jgi:phenylpyruvate tautomerase PptA (4-oxalocrotonate tautomerase family)
LPLVRISLVKGKSPAYIRSIGDGVHRALVETYRVPVDDRFQLVQQHERTDFHYDPDFLGVHRTDEVVFIHIVASRTRDTATKQVFYRAVVDNLSADPGLRPEDVFIIISPNDREDWSFGNGLASYVSDDLNVPSSDAS